MPLFEDEKWTVVPRSSDDVRRGGTASHAGFLIEGMDADGNVVDIVTERGMLATERDLRIATLFSASNDLFNAAEAVLPMLSELDYGMLDLEYQIAIDNLVAALKKAGTPKHGLSDQRERDPASLPPGGPR